MHRQGGKWRGGKGQGWIGEGESGKLGKVYMYIFIEPACNV